MSAAYVGRPVCHKFNQMNHTFSNSEHILMTTEMTISDFYVFCNCFWETWDVNVYVSKALWICFCCLNVPQALNKTDVTINTKRLRHHS